MISKRAKSVWAKTGGAEQWLPLTQHMLDSRAVAALLVEYWLSPQVRRRWIAHPLGSDGIGRIAVFLAAVHDVGKASPVFVAQSEPLAQRTRDTGLPCPIMDELRPDRAVLQHSVVSQHALRTWLIDLGLGSEAARGLASVIVIAGLIITTLVFAQFHLWDPIFRWLGGLDIRMNAGGYFAIALPLFLVWVFSTFVYDRYVYLIVTRGQIRIRQAIGDGEIAVDSTGLVLEKKRNDLFRHWLLGLGSGDLHVKTGGPSNLDFDLPNVAFVGSKIDRIQDLLRERETAQQVPRG